ncbi:MAG TPA: hypothetical protein VGD90_01770 [Sphingobacteriaceae bacterium]
MLKSRKNRGNLAWQFQFKEAGAGALGAHPGSPDYLAIYIRHVGHISRNIADQTVHTPASEHQYELSMAQQFSIKLTKPLKKKPGFQIFFRQNQVPVKFFLQNRPFFSPFSLNLG